MYVPYYKHPLFKNDERAKFRERWLDPKTNQENACYQKIIYLIQNSPGKHMLNSDFYNGNLPTIEDDLDLRGFKIWKLEQDFCDSGDTFKGLNFSHSEFWHSNIKNAVFYSCSFDFSRFYNCTFENCAFAFTNMVGAKFEKCKFIECDFGEPCTWENVMLVDTKFSKCFLGRTTPFFECYFDDQSEVVEMLSFWRKGQYS
jgi:uncharacterized protein YjbI with pentapeptide repeats